MPIKEEYKEEALLKLKRVGDAIRPRIEELIKTVDPEDIEFGTRVELKAEELEALWKECVEENNYMSVVFTEVMEHHDGAYLKVIFKNSTEDYEEDRYVNVRSSGRVEISHALFVTVENVRARVERVGEGAFVLFLKSS
ncbi:MAG: hypothetical protein NZ526_04735 [Aquificaceae bacterium]|nr:hypothetical protein [Aquificaceae bacterium]